MIERVTAWKDSAGKFHDSLKAAKLADMKSELFKIMYHENPTINSVINRIVHYEREIVEILGQ